VNAMEPLRDGMPADVAASRPSERPVRILIADDEPLLQQFYAQVLTPCGYQVDAAKDGVAAWESLCADSYDLLITDNNMPKLSGLELVEKLRAARMTLPTLLASGSLPMNNSTPKVSAALLKPFSPHALLSAVNEVLRAANPGRRRAGLREKAEDEVECSHRRRSGPARDSTQQEPPGLTGPL
jgi:DNA-binding response OmpR family regulator